MKIKITPTWKQIKPSFGAAKAYEESAPYYASMGKNDLERVEIPRWLAVAINQLQFELEESYMTKKVQVKQSVDSPRQEYPDRLHFLL